MEELKCGIFHNLSCILHFTISQDKAIGSSSFYSFLIKQIKEKTSIKYIN